MAQPGEITTMDICIGMDVTGSMGTWIQASRDTVIDAVKELQELFPNCHFRLSFVAYRDFGDDEPFIIIPFNDDIAYVQTNLLGIVAMGGNDTPEDVAGALEHITNLDWKSQKKLIFIVTDAPAHGTEYHRITMGDRYSEGDPNGRNPCEQMKVLASMGIDFTIFRVTSEIDTMIEKFASVYQKSMFKVLDVEKQMNDSKDEDEVYEYGYSCDRSLSMDLSAPSVSSDIFKKGLVLMATDSLSH